MMKALAKVKPLFNEIEIISVPYPKTVEDKEVMVEILSVGVCGTDLSIYKWTETVAEEYNPKFPLILGHELAGKVTKVGSDVNHTSVGDHVAINPHISCLQCDYCLQSRESLCENRKLIGCHGNGGLTQYITIRGSNVYKLPANLPIYLGSLAEPLSVAMHSLEKLKTEQGKFVGIIGAGTIGLLQLLVCKENNLKPVIFGLNSDQERLNLAEKLGGIPINIEKMNPIEEFKRITGQQNADAVFEMAGANSAVDLAIELVKPGGQVALVGIATKDVPIDTAKVVYLEKELIGVRAYNRSTWPKTIQVMGKISEDLKHLVTHQLKLEEFQEAIELLKNRQCIKAIINPNA